MSSKKCGPELLPATIRFSPPSDLSSAPIITTPAKAAMHANHVGNGMDDKFPAVNADRSGTKMVVSWTRNALWMEEQREGKEQ